MNYKGLWVSAASKGQVERAKRSDAGTVRVTQRDYAALAWLSEMKAVYEPDLGVLFGRLAGGEVPKEGALRAVVRRWEKAGLARSQKLLMHAPKIVRLLSGGARLAGEENWRETSEWTAYHQADTSRVRLWLESRHDLQHGRLVEWIGERAIRANMAMDFQGATKDVHVPDGIAVFDDGTHAQVEVERNLKEQARLVRIIGRVTAFGRMVIYAVPHGQNAVEERKREQIIRAVRTAYETVKSQSKNPTGVGPLQIAIYPNELEE